MQSRAYTYTRVRTLIYKTKSPPRGARRHHPNYTLDFAKRIASHQQAPPTVLSPVYALRRPVSMTATYSDVCRNSSACASKTIKITWQNTDIISPMYAGQSRLAAQHIRSSHYICRRSKSEAPTHRLIGGSTAPPKQPFPIDFAKRPPMTAHQTQPFPM